MWYQFSYELTHPQSNKICYLWAADAVAADELATTLRFKFSGGNLNQKISEFRPIRLMQEPGGVHRPDVFHAICFLTFIGVRAGLNLDRLTGDNSPVHTLSHSLAFGGVNHDLHLDNIIEQCLWLERVVPGIPPDDIRMEIVWQAGTDLPVDDRCIEIERIERLRRNPFSRFPSY